MELNKLDWCIMHVLRALTPQMDVVAEIDNYESLIYNCRWHKPGEFELHINKYTKDVDKLIKGSLIMLRADPRKVGIIKHREIKLTSEGKISENWVIRGWTLSGVTYQRITIPPSEQTYDSITGDAESAMKHYITTNLINPEYQARKIEMLMNAPNMQRGINVTRNSRFIPLADELEKISHISGLGWDIYLDIEQKKWVFEVYEGKDLTTSQVLNPPVILSPEFEATERLLYVDSDLNRKTVAYVGGQGEGADREIVRVEEQGDNIDFSEAFIDARDAEDSNQLEFKGYQYLAEMAAERSLTGQILTKSPFKYQEDYDLGDLVTVQNKGWGITMDARITEIQEIFEPGGFKLEVTFGKSQPTLIEKIKREFEQVGAEVRR